MCWWHLFDKAWSALYAVGISSREWLRGVSSGDWLLFGAELAVAGVIWLELDAGRLDRFLNELSSHYAARQSLHTIITRVKASAGTSWVSLIRDDDELRDLCNHEIVAISNQVLLGGRWARRNWMVKYGPHSLVRFWDLLDDYVTQKRVADGGLWGKELLSCISMSARRLAKTRLPVRLSDGRTLDSGKLNDIASKTSNLARRPNVPAVPPPDKTVPSELPAGWETVTATVGRTDHTDRLKVEGGWMYRTRVHDSIAVIFVPPAAGDYLTDPPRHSVEPSLMGGRPPAT